MYLIVGGDSLIGNALGEYWKANNVPFHKSTRRQQYASRTRPFIDLEQQSWTFSSTYKGVVLCAAISKISACQQNPILSKLVNVTATEALAQELAMQGSHILFLSTNQVFDGTIPLVPANHPLSPKTIYGQQKAEAEKRISSLPQATILRLTKVIHDDFPLFQKWRTQLLAGETIHPFSDMFFAPIQLTKVVKVIDLLLQTKSFGRFQLSAKQDISYGEYVKKMAIKLQINPKLVQPKSAKESGFLTKDIPKHTSLKTNIKER